LAALPGCASKDQQSTPAASVDTGVAAAQPVAAGKSAASAGQNTAAKAGAGGVFVAPPPLAASNGTGTPQPAGASGEVGNPELSTAGTGGASSTTEHFSFFVTSHVALKRVSNNPDGFGGDLRYGEADGLTGADKICREIAESSMPGAGAKTWRAFLSVTKGADGKPVHAIDRVGTGPWYDRIGRLFAMTREDLLNVRPKGGDAAIVDDFPNEDGVPNHAPDGVEQLDNHDMLTGTNDKGQLFDPDWKFTCRDWTSVVGSDGTPRVGHSWPRSGTPVMWRTGAGTGGGDFPMMPRRPRPPAAGSGPNMGGGAISGDNWMSALNEAGCAPGASLVEMGGPRADNPTVGSGGGYGGIYCFALTP
jgi:hypothetical protein